MRRLTPETVLQSNQILATRFVLAMLARYGFEHKRTTGSHVQCMHQKYDDEIVGLVYGTSNLIYQHKAAEACLRVAARDQQSVAQAAPEPENKSLVLDLPDTMELHEIGGHRIVRDKKYPCMGFKYQGPIYFQAWKDWLVKEVANFAYLKDNMQEKLEYTFTPLEDGSIHVAHPIYELEEVLVPFGVESEVAYPVTSLRFLAEYAINLDALKRLVFFDQQHGIQSMPKHHVRTTKLDSGLYRHSVGSLPGEWGDEEPAAPVVLTSTYKGRMSFDDALAFHEYHIRTLQAWKRNETKMGCIFTENPDGTVSISHRGFSPEIVAPSIEQAFEKLNELRLEVAAGHLTLDMLEVKAENARAYITKGASFRGVLDRFIHLLVDESKGYRKVFSQLNKTMIELGFRREDVHMDDEPYLIRYVHKDDSTRIFEMSTMSRKVRGAYVPMPHKKLITELTAYIDALQRPRAAQPVKEHKHVLSASSAVPAFSITLSPVKPAFMPDLKLPFTGGKKPLGGRPKI